MTQDVLLHQLRERLRLVADAIVQREAQRSRGHDYAIFADGALAELRFESAFLQHLIDQVEHEGVQS